MADLYETIQRIEQVIAKRGLPGFKTKGLIALRAGFSLALVHPATPDDAAKLERLRQAAARVLGERV